MVKDLLAVHRPRFNPWVRKIPWRWKWLLTPMFLPGEWTEEPGRLWFMGVTKSWTHLSNKASGGDGIAVELFQILKDDAVKGLHSICQQIWKTQQWPQDWKRSVFIPIPKKGNDKESSNYRTIALISHISAAAAAAKSRPLCLIPCNPMDCSPPGSSVHGISQARVLEWVAIAFSTSIDDTLLL